MADTTSANYGWTLPEDGASTGTWGPKLNNDIGGTVSGGAAVEGIDSVVKSVSVVANGAIQKSGGATDGLMSGELSVVNVTYRTITLGTSGALSLDLASATAFLCSPTGSITFTIANASTTRDYAFFRIKFVGNGGAGVALTWPATVKDATSISIGPAGSTVTILELMTFDHGGSWYYKTLATGRTP